MKKYGFVNLSDPKRVITRLYDSLTVNPSPSDILFKSKALPIPISYLISGKGEGNIVWKYVGTKEIRPSNEVIQEAISKYLD